MLTRWLADIDDGLTVCEFRTGSVPSDLHVGVPSVLQ